jgi:hypothetical protein
MGAIFCNLMRDAGQRGLQVHLVNATYSTPERYAPLRSTSAICRADVMVAKIPKQPVLRLLCWGHGKDWQLVPNVNGTDLEPVDAAKIQDTAWIDVRIKPALLKEGVRNRVTLRLAGKPNAWSSHAAVYIDAEKSEPQSAFSSDAGKTYDSNDLSMLAGVQRGAYMVQITEVVPPRPIPAEMRVHLVPHENVEVRVSEASVPPNASALAISPDLPPERIPLRRGNGLTVLRVPKLQVYSVIVLSADEAYLASIEAKARTIKHDPLPPRTPEFRKLLEAGAAGEKLARTDLEGDFRLRGVTSTDPSKVTGRTDPRPFGVEITRGKDFGVEPDGRLYRLPGGRVYSRDRICLTWTGPDGGHYREIYEPYTALAEGQLIPPGWSVVLPLKAKVYRETEPANVHGGEASARVVTGPGAGIGTISLTTDPGRPYRLSVWLKVAKGEAQIVVTSGAKVEPLRCSAPQWTKCDLDFVADKSNVYLRVLGAPGQPESVFYVDDASLRERTN